MVGFKQWRKGRGWNEKERKSKNILMFEKRVEMNKIRYGGTRGGKLVIVRAKVNRLESCHALIGGGGVQSRYRNFYQPELFPFYQHVLLHTYKTNYHI